MDGHRAINRAFWDEVAPHHATSDYYAIEEFLATRDSLGAIERDELGDVAGLSVCHLQCHLGLDTLSLAARGARVAGVDFSAESLRIARGLAERTGLPATFVEADVLETPDRLQQQYDLVFTTRGVLMWIEDLDGWAHSCAALLRPGGTFYLLDLHPLALITTAGSSGLHVTGSYFASGPTVSEGDGSYAVQDVGLQHRQTWEWVHPLGAVITALADAGIMIDFVHEHPADAQSGGVPELPGWYSVRGRRAG